MDENKENNPQDVLTRTGSNYVESGTVPRHVDTSVFDKKKSPVKTVLFILIIILFVGWAYLVYSDYGRVKNGSDPEYCFLGKEVENLKEGSISVCKGLGYKVVEYKKIDAKMTEFVPLWEANKTLDILDSKE